MRQAPRRYRRPEDVGAATTLAPCEQHIKSKQTNPANPTNQASKQANPATRQATYSERRKMPKTNTPSVPEVSRCTISNMCPSNRILGGAFVAFLLASGIATAETTPTTAAAASRAAGMAVAPNLSGELLRPLSKVRSLPRDVRLAAGEGTTLQTTFTSSLPVGERGAKVLVQTVEVDGGRVDAYLPFGTVKRGILLQAPDKILGISTDGHMVMKVDAQTVVIGALSGDVLIGQDSKFKPLPEGKIRVISRMSGVAKDFVIPAAPVVKNKAGLSVALTGSVRVGLEVATAGPTIVGVVDELGAEVVAPRRYEAGVPIEVEVPHAGVYYAVARSIGEGGIEGPLSSPTKIQVLGLAAGQRAPVNGVFLVGSEERVRLAGTEGLEVRYGNSPTYLPASNSVGLSQSQKTLVEFRNPEDTEQRVLLTLAPRFQRKEIELGPKEARWPGDPVKMRIGMWDGAGNLIRPGDGVDVRVTVNSGDVPVSWKPTSGGYVAQIPRQQGEGPWVVRVNVKDEKGHTIARDFLEVTAH